MRKYMRRMLCSVLALGLLLSLCACGKQKTTEPNHYDFGDYMIVYKGACIMQNESGKDALVMTFDFTNNSKEDASYGWTVYEKPMQNGTELESTYVVTDPETYAGVSDNMFTDIAPGETIEVGTAYLLNGTSEVTMTISDLWDKYTYKITVDPANLTDTDPLSVDTTGTGDILDTTGSNDALDAASFLSWWDGDWYGWWIISDGTGTYDECDGYWWDVCATIEADADMTGHMVLWDSNDRSRDAACCNVEVSFSDAGTGPHGTMFSESGQFVDNVLAHADWIVDPGLKDVDDLIWIDGDYEDADGSFSYAIYLRP